jgi:hypothetical protein
MSLSILKLRLHVCLTGKSLERFCNVQCFFILSKSLQLALIKAKRDKQDTQRINLI